MAHDARGSVYRCGSKLLGTVSPRQPILERLSERARYYCLAQSAGDALLEEQNRIELSSLLESLLEAHLRDATGWEAGAWVETVVSVTVDVAEGEVVLAGAAVWHGSAGWFLEPLRVRAELSSGFTSVHTYALQFGDAERGLGSVSYQPGAMASRRALPAAWCFVFRDSR